LADVGTSDTPLVVVVEEDEHMPGLTGTQLIEISLRAGAPTSRLEFVLLTDHPEAVPAALTGRVLVLAEPPNLEELLEAVARAATRLSRQ
jgi:hypothetical protein